LRWAATPGADPGVGPDGETGAANEPATWKLFLRLVARERPIALLVDDFHLADHALSSFVAGLTGLTGVPLLVVVTGRPALFRREPAWGAAEGHVATLSLEPFRPAEADRHNDPASGLIPAPYQPDGEDRTGSFRTTPPADIDAWPGDRRHHGRSRPARWQ
ncbi:hypothetical protein, partial [Frankia sp. CcWB3]